MRLIDADELKEIIAGNSYILSNSINSMNFGMFLDGIEQAIDESPTIDALQHGRWKHERLPSTSGGSYAVVRCSVCEHQYPMTETNYCPNCGAKMDKETK